MSVLSAPATALRGYRAGPSNQRAGFWISTAFAVTVAASRAVNYIRERRRVGPRVRSWGRRVYHSPGEEQLRVHHYLPGIAALLVAGGTAVLTRTDGEEHWFGIPFGVGAGLTLDEVGMLAELDNPYWEGEVLSIIQAGIGATTAGVLAAAFYRRGAGLDDDDDGREERQDGSDRPGADRQGGARSVTTG